MGTMLELPGGELLRWMGVMLIGILGSWEYLKKNTPFKVFPYQYSLLLFPAMFSFFHDSNIASIGIMRSASFFFLIYALSSYYSREKVTREYIESHFTIFSTFLVGVMSLQGTFLLMNLNEFGFFKGIYNNKNYFTSIGIVALICTIWLIIRNEKYKILYKMYFLLITVLLVATGSRTALIGIVIVILSLPIIFFEQTKAGGKLKIILVMLLILGFSAIAIQYIEIPALTRLLSEKSIDGSTGFSRSGWWYNAIPIFQKKPLFGWGNSAVYYHITNLNEGELWGFHNSYLVILVENGIIGSLFYLFFFVVSIYKTGVLYYKSNLKKHEKKLIKLMVLICMFLMINAFAEAFLFAVGNPMSVSFWLILIMLERYLSLTN